MQVIHFHPFSQFKLQTYIVKETLRQFTDLMSNFYKWLLTFSLPFISIEMNINKHIKGTTEDQ